MSRVLPWLFSASIALSATQTARAQLTLAPSPAPTPAPPPAPTSAPPPPPLTWDPAWTHAGVWDYAITGAALTAFGLETVFLQIEGTKQTPHWIGPILLDESVDQALGHYSHDVQENAATASWVLWFTEVGYPLAVDLPYAAVRYGRQVAWDLFWQDAMALSLGSAVDLGIRDTVNRARPFVSACLSSGGTGCVAGPESTRSFPSGHVTETSTATALVCTQHLKLHLYGEPWDAVTCGAAISADVAVGVLRLMTDNHYLSDVLAGAALGTLFGWGVPVLMHLHGHADAPDARPTGVDLVPMPMVFEGGGGVGVAAMY